MVFTKSGILAHTLLIKSSTSSDNKNYMHPLEVQRKNIAMKELKYYLCQWKLCNNKPVHISCCACASEPEHIYCHLSTLRIDDLVECDSMLYFHIISSTVNIQWKYDCILTYLYKCSGSLLIFMMCFLNFFSGNHNGMVLL